jgi:glycosyltransferase involved in cell wall biosynthesis
MMRTLIDNRLSYFDKKDYEKFNVLCNVFSTRFIKNILASIDFYIDLSPEGGFYVLLAGYYYPDLTVVAIEADDVYAQLLRDNVKNLGLENITVQLESDRLEEVTTAICSETHNNSLLIRLVLDEDNAEEIKLVIKILRKFEKVKLILEINQSLVGKKTANLKIVEEIINSGFAIWILDDQSNQFLRVTSENIKKLIEPVSSYIFYCVKNSYALSMCFFSHSPGLGGSEKVMFELVDSLIKDYGVICTVIVPREGYLSEALKEIGAATLCAFPNFAEYGWWCDGPGNEISHRDIQMKALRFSQAIENNVLGNIRKFDPDVIWTQTLVIPWGAQVAEKLNKPHIWYVTEFGELDFGFKFFSPLMNLLEEIQSTSNHVYTCSQILKDTLFPASEREKVSVLYCCIPMPLVSPKQGNEQCFSKKDSVKIGIFSQIRPIKGQEDAVLALAQCVRSGFNVELVIAGGADELYIKYLMALVKDNCLDENVKFAGYRDNPFDLMSLCDIIIMASRLEAFGRVGVEAMLLSKPVVFANTGGISEYQLDGETGLSYSPGDSTGLARQLMHLMNEPALRDKMGIAGKLHALNLFSKKNFSERVYFDAKKIAGDGRGSCMTSKSIEELIKGAIETLRNERNYRKIIGRNEVCPCNSGKKYKYCCGILT